jgi:hypothetical protein
MGIQHRDGTKMGKTTEYEYTRRWIYNKNHGWLDWTLNSQCRSVCCSLARQEVLTSTKTRLGMYAKGFVAIESCRLNKKSDGLSSLYEYAPLNLRVAFQAPLRQNYQPHVNARIMMETMFVRDNRLPLACVLCNYSLRAYHLILI